MTSKLKCPFCGEKLERDGFHIQCPDIKCRHQHNLYGSYELWQALTQAKQDLAKAIDVIDTVRQHKRGTAVICPNDIAAYCDRALEQIEHKE